VVAERVGVDADTTGQEYFAVGGPIAAVRDVVPDQLELRWFGRKG